MRGIQVKGCRGPDLVDRHLPASGGRTAALKEPPVTVSALMRAKEPRR